MLDKAVKDFSKRKGSYSIENVSSIVRMHNKVSFSLKGHNTGCLIVKLSKVNGSEG